VRSRLFLAFTSLIVVLGLAVAGCAPDAAPTTPDGQTTQPTTPSTPSAPAEKAITWKMQGHMVTGMRYYVIVSRIAERVTEMSGGRLIIEHFPGGAIVPSTKELEATNDRVMDACVTGHMYNMHLFPQAGLFYQVVGGLTATQMQLWYLSGGGDELATRMYEPLDVHYVATPLLHPPEIWCHSNKELKTANDLKGLKFRAAGDAGEIVARMGASVVMVPGQEIYEAMSRGVIDAFEYGGPAVDFDQGFQEIADYVYLSPSRAPTGGNAMFVNQDAWDELTSDLQLVVRMAAQAEMQQWYAEEIVLDDLGIQKFIDYGTKVVQLPAAVDDEFQRVAAGFYAEKAKADPFFAEVVASQTEFKRICTLQDIK